MFTKTSKRFVVLKPKMFYPKVFHLETSMDIKFFIYELNFQSTKSKFNLLLSILKYIKLHHAKIASFYSNITQFRNRMESFEDKLSVTSENTNENFRKIERNSRNIIVVNTTVSELGINMAPVLKTHFLQLFSPLTQKTNNLQRNLRNLDGRIQSVGKFAEEKIKEVKGCLAD